MARLKTFECEGIASSRTIKLLLKRLAELSMLVPSGYVFGVKAIGSGDHKPSIGIGGTKFDLKFYVFEITSETKMKEVYVAEFEDSDGTLRWGSIYNRLEKFVKGLKKAEN